MNPRRTIHVRGESRQRNEGRLLNSFSVHSRSISGTMKKPRGFENSGSSGSVNLHQVTIDAPRGKRRRRDRCGETLAVSVPDREESSWSCGLKPRGGWKVRGKFDESENSRRSESATGGRGPSPVYPRPSPRCPAT